MKTTSHITATQAQNLCWYAVFQLGSPALNVVKSTGFLLLGLRDLHGEVRSEMPRHGSRRELWRGIMA